MAERLGELLVREKLINAEQLKKAIEEQRSSGGRLGYNLAKLGYINEKDLGRVKLNQKAHVMTDSYHNKKYSGWISFISQQAEFTPKYIQTTEERVKYVYRIKVRVDNSTLDLKPGMPADAYIADN